METFNLRGYKHLIIQRSEKIAGSGGNVCLAVLIEQLRAFLTPAPGDRAADFVLNAKFSRRTCPDSMPR